MKKNFLCLVLSILSFLGFSMKTEAASVPNTIVTGYETRITQYVDGYQAYLKTTNGGADFLFCEVANLAFPRNRTLSLGSEVDKGFTYIIKNRPTTGDSNKNFYIMQMAVWWYKDILIGGSSNLAWEFKTYCTDNRATDSTCNSIYNLVVGARNYVEPRGEMSFSSATVNFSEVSGYYVSDPITFTSKNIVKFNGLVLKSAPVGSSIISSTVDSNSKNGTFVVRVPKNSIPEGATVTFSVEADGTYETYSAYDYYYSSEYQKVIYDKLFTTSHTTYASKVMRVTRVSVTTTTTAAPTTTTTRPTNLFTVYKVDESGQPLRGAQLALYNGNCVNTTCSDFDLYGGWVTALTPMRFRDIPVGYYTLAEKEAPNGYRTANKALIYISRNDSEYTYTVVNVKENTPNPVRISKTDITGTNEIEGATLVLKDSVGRVVETWVSTKASKYIVLPAGDYSLTEKYAPEGYKLSTETIYFRVDDQGNVYARNEHGQYVAVEYIRMVNAVKDKVSITKLDKSTNGFVLGATLVLKNEKGEVVSSWTTTSESYYIALQPGTYTVEETFAPTGYVLNTKIVHFRALEDGSIMVQNDNGIYELANGIIFYNIPEVKEEIVEVPKTGLTSIVTYISGTFTLLGGALMLIKNGKIA